MKSTKLLAKLSILLLLVLAVLRAPAQPIFPKYKNTSPDNYIPLDFLTQQDYTNPKEYHEKTPLSPVGFGRSTVVNYFLFTDAYIWQPSVIPIPSLLGQLHIRKIYAYCLYDQKKQTAGGATTDSICLAAFGIDSIGRISTTYHINPTPHSSQLSVWMYDDADHLTTIYKKFEGAQHNYGIEKYQYDTATNSVYTTWYQQDLDDPDSFNIQKVVRQQYDKNNRLISLYNSLSGEIEPLTQTRTCFYDEFNGRLVAEKFRGLYGILYPGFYYEYNIPHQKTSIFQNLGNGNLLIQENYYDNEDRCIRVIRHFPDNVYETIYTYNPDGTLYQTEERNDETPQLITRFYYVK